jgi:hypothetical protein
MKKSLFTSCSLFLVAFLFITGCQKTKDLKYENKAEAERHKDGDKEECRLTKLSSEYGQEIFEYNRKGLVGKWTVIYPGYEGYFLLEYDPLGQLVRAKFYDPTGLLLNTIKFIYWNNKSVKDVWYEGNTNVKTDEVVHTRNRNGKIVKSESIMGDYYTLYNYTDDGNNVSEWKYFVGGLPVYQGDYTYLNPYKNPELASRGINYSFPFINGAYSENKLYSTSEKFTYFDEAGNAIVDSYQDPSKTIATVNAQNYVTTSDFYNVLSDDWVHFVFDYENCGSCGNCNTRSAAKLPAANTGSLKIRPFNLLIKGSAKSIKEQVKKLRMKFGK